MGDEITMTTKQQRDGNGRFTGSKKTRKPENPDCEPATKGYVKCLIRKTRDHTHGHDICWGATFLGMVGGFAFFLFVLLSGNKEAADTMLFPDLFFTLACALATLDLHITNNTNTTYGIEESEPEILKKYIPPEEIDRVCKEFNKPKKECE